MPEGGSVLDQGRRTLVSDGPLMDAADGENKLIGGDSFQQRTANPSWLGDRCKFYDEIKARRAQEREALKPVEISVTLPDGSVLSQDKAGKAFMAYQTTPFHVAATISQGLADASTVARITYEKFADDYDPAFDGMGASATAGLADAMEDLELEDTKVAEDEDAAASDGMKPMLWDMSRPLVGPVKRLELLKFNDDQEAKTVFWHSSAHMLGEALEHLFGSKLTIGPPLKGGFYYDSYMGSDSIKEDDYKPIEKEVQKIIKQKQKFERMVVTKDEALEMFADNPFKVKILSTKVPDGTRTTVYRCGDLIDLCRGPHVTHTGKVKAFAAAKHSAAYWLGDAENDSLQRIYGISFPDKKQLKVWQEMMEKAKERDHRRIATKQELVFFHDLSPGSAFWLPHGTRIYNRLVNFIKQQYWERGYSEVITPNIFNLDLWHQSGHAMHYKEDMFCFDVEGQEWAMKPMNCPAHCLMFAHSIRSYRDLPIRYGDFGVLHRNELSGALTGLTRVRRFQQDDAHVFCRQDQITQEVIGALNFMKYVYNIFGMSYKLELSTRPKKALGERGLWDTAEAALEEALNIFNGKGNWRVNPGDGAFYGPKIDIKISDAMDRVHQCATVQLDFQLPIRFDLKYTTDSKEEGKQFARPVIVHRAMLGSVERMFAVLCEHWAGKWPFWISPRQAMVIPIHKDFGEYADSIRQKIHEANMFADVDLSKSTFQKKVRNAQIAQYNFQLVVGKSEVENGTVNIRTRENKVEGEMKVDEMIEMFKRLRDEYK
jgi:threonyl-tRNA synthetase